MKSALAVLEDTLRARKLDGTLTSAIPPGKGDGQVAPAALSELDASLHGGLPRGQLSELVGPASSGRTTLLLQMLAAATRRGEIVALVDTFDRLDLASVVAAGVDLDRLLWIRGHTISRAEGLDPRPQSGIRTAGLSLRPDALLDRTIDRALKHSILCCRREALAWSRLILRMRCRPRYAVFRLRHGCACSERSRGVRPPACLVASQPLGRSAHGLTLALDSRMQWAGQPTRPGISGPDSAVISRTVAAGATASVSAPLADARGLSSRSDRLAGLDVTVRVVSPRRRVDGDVMVAATASW